MVPRLKIYAINLARAADRREAIVRQLDELAAAAEFVPACDGHAADFSFDAYAHLLAPEQRGTEFKPGAFACFISHARVWERIADGDEPFGLVIEDDVTFDRASFQHRLMGPYPEGVDIVFVNRRMYKLAVAAGLSTDFAAQPDPDRWMDKVLDEGRPPGRPDAARFVPVTEVLDKLFAARYYRATFYATGGDGYVVSRSGARRLLDMLHSRKIRMGVDFAMVLNSLSPQLVLGLSDDVLGSLPPVCRNFIQRERAGAASSPPMGLKSVIDAEGWLVRTDGAQQFPSTIKHRVLRRI